jgi:hypothetical protein
MAEMLQLSEQQVKHLKRGYRANTVECVRHGNQGRTPANAISGAVRQSVIEFATAKYMGFNDTHLQQEAAEKEGISERTPDSAPGWNSIPTKSCGRASTVRDGRDDREKVPCSWSTAAGMIGWKAWTVPHAVRLGG